MYIVFDTSKVGLLRLSRDDVIVEYRGYKIYVKVENMYLSDNTISSHMSAIHTLLRLLGPYVDVNITLPNFSVFYALTSYKGKRSRAICLTQDLINQRLCKVAYTLQMRNIGDYKEEDDTCGD